MVVLGASEGLVSGPWVSQYYRVYVCSVVQVRDLAVEVGRRASLHAGCSPSSGLLCFLNDSPRVGGR